MFYYAYHDLLILCYSASFQMGPDYILSLHEANQLLVDELHTLFDLRGYPQQLF